jgi:Trm5-related predicted tRNA methylase
LARKELYKEKKTEEKQIKAEEKRESFLPSLLEKVSLKENTSALSKTWLRRVTSCDQIAAFYRQRLASAVMNDASRVVFDCRFLPMHTRGEAISSINRQMEMTIHCNKHDTQTPFQIFFCNYNTDTEFHKRFAAQLNYDDNFIFETSKSYTSLFPKRDLVYLTADSPNPMKAYDPSKVYIIGNIMDNDREKFKLASLSQAKKDSIRTERLPDQYIKYTFLTISK